MLIESNIFNIIFNFFIKSCNFTAFIYFNNINGDTFDLISKTKKRFLRGRYTGETYKIGNEVNITMINIDEFSGDIEFNLNYKRKNLASRGKVLTQKPNKK